MFSFKKSKNSKRIAIIKGGKHNKKTIYLSQPDNKANEHVEDSDSDSDSECECDSDDHKYDNISEFLTDEEIRDIHKKLGLTGKRRKRAVVVSKLKDLLYNDSDKIPDEKKQLDSKILKNMIINDGHLEMLPYANGKVQRILAGGPSECGKSYFCSKYIKKYKKLNTDNHFVLISDTTKDNVLDKLKPLRLSPDSEIIKESQPDDFKNSLILFDDIDAITDVKISKQANRFRDSMLTKGRHNNNSIICTTHEICDGHISRTMLRECTHYVIFPRSGKGQLVYLLKKKLMLNNKQINNILSLPSRWVIICKTYPRHVIYESGCFILD